MNYEYMTVVLNKQDADDSGILAIKLNSYGKSGWELVSVVSQSCLGSVPYSLIGISPKNTLIFKRGVEL